MKLHKKIFAAVASVSLAFFAFSCVEGTNSAAQNGYVEITVKRTSNGNSNGYQTYRFDVPMNGFDKVYAARCTADNNANVDQYIIRALSSDDWPFDAVDVHVTPEKSSEGEWTKATATVRLAEYRKDSDKLSQSTGFYWTINADEHGLSQKDYSVPMADGGIFTLNFTTDDDDGVYERGYNNNTSNYPLLSIKIAAPVSKY